jgi:hypothetical protein
MDIRKNDLSMEVIQYVIFVPGTLRIFGELVQKLRRKSVQTPKNVECPKETFLRSVLQVITAAKEKMNYPPSARQTYL